MADTTKQQTQATPQLPFRYPQPLPVKPEDVPGWIRKFCDLQQQHATAVENRINEVERKIP